MTVIAPRVAVDIAPIVGIVTSLVIANEHK